MNEALWLVVAAISALAGMSWLALAMPEHWKQVFHAVVPASPQSGLLRLMGSAALILSALCCGMADHPSMAVLVWFMLSTAAAFVVAVLLARYPVVLRVIWPKPPMRSNPNPITLAFSQ